MLNKAIVASFLATSAIAFGVATARADCAAKEQIECVEPQACGKALAPTSVPETGSDVDHAQLSGAPWSPGVEPRETPPRQKPR